MNRIRRTLITGALAMLMALAGIASAAAPLPPAGWYAVAWNEAADTLHWINANGEQASLPRPHLPNEADGAEDVRVLVSPNGRTLVITASLNNGRAGIGIYDLASGQFVRTHTADDGEIFLDPGRASFTESSMHVVAALRNLNSGDWRLVVYELSSGNAVDVLTRTDPNTPDNFITDPTWQPVIAQFNVDEGSGQTEVRFQIWLDTREPMLTFPSFKWVPNTGGMVPAQSVTPDAFPYSPRAGYDVHPATGQIVLAWYDDAQAPADSAASANSIRIQNGANQLPAAVLTQYGANTRQPVWLKGGEWIGFRMNNGIHQTHRVVMSATGLNAVPLGPNISALYHTPDGFLALDREGWRLLHQTSLNLEGFSASFGNTVFAPGVPFSVIYTTPAATAFTLASIADAPAVVNQIDDLAAQPTEAQPTPVVIVAVDLSAVQPTQTPLQRAPLATATPAPQVMIPLPEQICLNAPEKKLAVGDTAHVLDLGGTLAMRTQLSDAIPSNQLPARTVMTLLAGPACRDGLRMWRVSASLNGGQVEGWVADGIGQTDYLKRGAPRANKQ